MIVFRTKKMILINKDHRTTLKQYIHTKNAFYSHKSSGPVSDRGRQKQFRPFFGTTTVLRSFRHPLVFHIVSRDVFNIVVTAAKVARPEAVGSI